MHEHGGKLQIKRHDPGLRYKRRNFVSRIRQSQTLKYIVGPKF